VNLERGVGVQESIKSIIGASCPIVSRAKVSPELRIVRAQAGRILIELDNFVGIPAIGVQVNEGSQAS